MKEHLKKLKKATFSLERTISEVIQIEAEFLPEDLQGKYKQVLLEIGKALEQLKSKEQIRLVKDLSSLLLGSTLEPLTFEDREWAITKIGEADLEYNIRCPKIVRINGQIRYYNCITWIDKKTGETFIGPFSDFLGYVTIKVDKVLPVEVVITVDKEKGKIIDTALYKAFIATYTGKQCAELPN